ncbi:MAG: hypothetical protein GY832_44785 [Chloroflexi bacterium]|nr:hypothetical protein [Chloroflexota bacterium]
MLINEMIEQTQSKLEEAQITTIRAMNDLDLVILLGNRPQIDDPDVSQASSNKQASKTHWIRDVTFVQIETSAFLVRDHNLGE